MNKTSMFNSLLLSVALAVLYWVGSKTASTGEAVVGLRAGVDAMAAAQAKDERANAEAHAAIQALNAANKLCTHFHGPSSLGDVRI